VRELLAHAHHGARDLVVRVLARQGNGYAGVGIFAILLVLVTCLDIF